MGMGGKDYYSLLGLAPGASEREIRLAYRRLALRYHPDLHPERADAEARLKELNEAYEVLGDPVRRARYAAQRGSTVRIRVERARPAAQATKVRSRPAAPGGTPEPRSRLWGHGAGTHVDLSGWGRGGPSAGAPRRGGEVRVEAPVEPPRAATGSADDDLALLLLWEWRRLLRALGGW
jgi:curved DNA-binding protein CbpA